MGKIVEKTFKKSNISAKNDYNFYRLERKNTNFLDCKIKRTNDEISFGFILKNEQPYTEVRNLPLVSKYQSLINIQNLYEESCKFKISLNPSNIYYDINMLPKVMMRDVYDENIVKESEFLEQYKALIGFVLQKKFTYEDYYHGGSKLLSKNKNTEVYVAAKTVEELVELLNNEYAKIKEKLKDSIIEVDKNKYKRTKIINVLSIGLLILSLGITGYFGWFRLNEELIFNKANEEYIKQDYISVIETLDKTKLNRMNKSKKYILAVSMIKVESLTEEQKNNIFSSVTLNSDDRILDFWVYLGRSNMKDAVDVAKQLGNKEYIAYAYMKEKSIVENDKSLSGQERETRLKAIEDNLKNIEILNEPKK